jgi:hypothetical protein
MNCIEITTRIGCKNNCLYCPQDRLLSAYKSDQYVMSFETFKLCLDKLPRSTKIHFSGFSEPFLNDDCISMISTAHVHKFDICIFTTTIGMNEHIIKTLSNIDLKSLYIHIPFPTRYISEFIANIKLLDKYHVDYSFISVGDYKYDESIIDILNNTNKKIIKQETISRAGNLGIDDGYIIGKIKCADDRQYQNVLLPNGDVYLCCCDYSLKHKLGNLLVDDYKDLFESSGFKRVLYGMDQDNSDIICRKCFRAVNI